MKKSLLLILGAAMLFAGCAKDLTSDLDNLTSRVDQIEKQVESNKKAIEALQKANFISKVEQTATGWSVTLSDGSVLALYNGAAGADGKPGADGKDGDAFFKSVEVKDGMVIFTLTDGKVIEIPFAEEFALKLDERNFVPNPDSEIKVPFTVVGKTPETEVYVMAGSAYEASIVGSAVVIKTPSTIVNGTVLVVADNGQGKTSIKSIELEKNAVKFVGVSAIAPFWGGDVTATIASNVNFSVKSKTDWLTVVSTKTMKESKVTIKAGPSPCSYIRVGEIEITDEYDKTVQTVKISQGGAPMMFINDKTSFKTFAEVTEAVRNGAYKDEATIDLAISEPETTIKEVLTIPALNKKWNIRVRSFGNGKAENCKIAGIRIEGSADAGAEVTINGITIEPMKESAGTASSKYNTYAYGIMVEENAKSPITIKNTIFSVTDDLKAYGNATMFYVYHAPAAIRVEGCKFIGRGSRISQIYGGNVVFDGNTIADSYSYAVRVGQANNNVSFVNNIVDTPVFVDVHSGAAAPTTVTIGNGTIDNNAYSSKVVTKVKGTAKDGVVINQGADANGKVTLGEYKFATIQAAVNAADPGAEIVLGEETFKENVKISKDVTIKGVSREKSVLAGNIEISSKCTLKNFTIRTEPGVTNNVLGVTKEGDAYKWGHIFLCRVENGASDVLIEDMDIRADIEDKDIMGTCTSLWLSQAKNVVVRNCNITSNPTGGYCNNQTYEGSVLFEGNTFTGGGKKGWAIRVASTAKMTLKNNTFHTGLAIDVLNTFCGVLTLGDGELDDNIYGSEVTKVLNGTKDVQIGLGAQFFPVDMVFGQPTTKVPATWEKAWSAKYEDLSIGDSRAFSYLDGEVICGVTATPIVSVEEGKLSKEFKFDFADASGFTGKITGMTLVENNGKKELLAGNVVSKGNKWAATNLVFQVYHYTDYNTVERVVNWTMATNEDAPQVERAGDYLTFRGTWQDGEILICAANGTGKYVYSFKVTDGKVEPEPTKIALSAEVMANKAGTAGIFYLKDDVYMITNESGDFAPLLVKRNGATIDLVGKMDVTKLEKKSESGKIAVRTPRIATIEGKDYMVFMAGEYGGDMGGADMGYIRVCVLPLVGSDIIASLSSYDIKDVKTLFLEKGSKNAGNGFAGLEVSKYGATLSIGYGARTGEIGVIKFRP